MNSQEILVDVVCDEFPDKIKLVKKNNTELPQKFYVAYIDQIRMEIGESSLPNDPASAYLYASRKDYLDHSKPLRTVNLLDTMQANGLLTKTESPTVIEFIARNKAA